MPILFNGGWGSSMYQYAHNDPSVAGVWKTTDFLIPDPADVAAPVAGFGTFKEFTVTKKTDTAAVLMDGQIATAIELEPGKITSYQVSGQEGDHGDAATRAADAPRHEIPWQVSIQRASGSDAGDRPPSDAPDPHERGPYYTGYIKISDDGVADDPDGRPVTTMTADEPDAQAISHATTVLAWARVDGTSPLDAEIGGAGRDVLIGGPTRYDAAYDHGFAGGVFVAAGDIEDGDSVPDILLVEPDPIAYGDGSVRFIHNSISDNAWG